MNPFYYLYYEILFRPLVNLLVGITDFIPQHNIGLAIILVTLLVRLVLLPSSLHQARAMQRNQTKMAGVRDKLKQIQEEHKNDATKRNAATMEVYRQAGINPASGCLPLLIQFPVLIALYQVFLQGIGEKTQQYLYPFIHLPATIETSFLGVALTTPSLVLAGIAGAAQFWQMRRMPTTATAGLNDDSSAKMMASMQRNMMYIFPVMTIFIAMRLPAALALYWVATTLFGLLQQYVIKRALSLESAPPVM